MPGTVESAASFVDWQEHLDTEHFPALNYAQGYHTILEHGEALFMPSGYWHHMQYMDSGFAMSLRAVPEGVTPKLNGLYHLFALSGFNASGILLFKGIEIKGNKAKARQETWLLPRENNKA